MDHKITIDVDVEIVRRALAEAQEEVRRADAHARTLSAEIERLRGENRLILDALRMERYRVYWRPVSDGFEETDDDILIVQNDPAFIAPIISIGRWDDVDRRLVTHWAPLPGLPREW